MVLEIIFIATMIVIAGYLININSKLNTLIASKNASAILMPAPVKRVRPAKVAK